MGWINATEYGSPVSVPFLGGEMAFGIGMQTGGGCASGTLFGLGGGNLRLAITLGFFVVGSVWGVHDIGYWRGLAILPLGNVQDYLGWLNCRCRS